MHPEQLQAWLALFATAASISDSVLASVQRVAKRTLTKEENQQVLAQWKDNVARSAANAGLPPPTDT